MDRDSASESNPPALLGSLAYLLDDFSFAGTSRPATSLERTVILELDVPSFATGPRVPPENIGAAACPYIWPARSVGILSLIVCLSVCCVSG